ncbi:hypothetical protein HBB16_03745 [Pseudonocardia sp. MCCB 268]|nr:hypothetical protein [Pseudonocardia cytotoxica]
MRLLAQMPQFASYASAREVAERAGSTSPPSSGPPSNSSSTGGATCVTRCAPKLPRLTHNGTAGRATSTDAAARMLRQDAADLYHGRPRTTSPPSRASPKAISTARRTVVITTGSGAGPA